MIQKLGLIADTRGAVLPDAVEVFARQRVDVILHAGNVGSASDALAPLEAVAPVIAVTGSEDEAIHHRLPWDLRLSFGGRRVFLCHEYDDSGRVVQEWQPHVLVYGHTEDAGIERRGSTLFVHPGRAERSVATLDLSGLEAEIHPTLADRG